MSRLLKHCCLLLCAAPAIAMASPVVLTTHSAGNAKLPAHVLQALGMDTAYAMQDLPYELSLSSTYDIGLTISYEGYSTYNDDIVVDFRLGDMRFQSGGTGSSYVWRGPSSGKDTYEHDVDYQTPAMWAFHFRHVAILDTPSLSDEGALELRELGPTDVVFGDLSLSAYKFGLEQTPGVSYALNGTMSTMSVRAVSPVPEPATYAMLAVGVLALGLRRRIGRAVA